MRDKDRENVSEDFTRDTPGSVMTIKVDGEEREIDPEMHGVWGQESWLRSDVPVPDPQGNAIPFRKLERAEEAMLVAMEASADRGPDPVPAAPREDPWWTRRHLRRPPEGASAEANHRWWDKHSRSSLEDERREAEERAERRRDR